MTTSIAELNAITKTVNKYADGIHNGDIPLLKSAFHPKAMMYGSSDKGVTIVEIEGLYAFVAAQQAPATTGEKHRCSISSIDIDGSAASIVMLEENGYGANYTNYFQLLKIEDEWLITSKCYNTRPVHQNATEAAAVSNRQ